MERLDGRHQGHCGRSAEPESAAEHGHERAPELIDAAEPQGDNSQNASGCGDQDGRGAFDGGPGRRCPR